MATPPIRTPIAPPRVLYIKLGEGGRWEDECRRDGIMRVGFGTGRPERFALAQAGRWQEFADAFVTEGRARGTATGFTNQTLQFFEDDGRTLWITFMGTRLCWGFLDGTPAQMHPDGGGASRRMADGWHDTDRGWRAGHGSRANLDSGRRDGHCGVHRSGQELSRRLGIGAMTRDAADGISE